MRDKDNVALDIYELEGMQRAELGWTIKFKKIRTGSSFRVSLSDAQMHSAGLTAEDWRHAPSFVVAPTVHGHPTRRVYFICVRLKHVMTIDLPKA